MPTIPQSDDDDDDVDDDNQSTSSDTLLSNIHNKHEWHLPGPSGNPKLQPIGCDLKQRLEPAHSRKELCFWFQVPSSLSAKINGSSARHIGTIVDRYNRLVNYDNRERLVESELHVFKLPPSSFLVGQTSNGGPNRSVFELVESGGIHLRTNLLEVSLYQILPKKQANHTPDQPSSEELHNGFPLRLLDIRRIDLYSSGWETFYIKRAVEDWIRDSSLNLGLVIKAKSMFEEPIRVGLIRFADLYDHSRIHREKDEEEHSSNYNGPETFANSNYNYNYNENHYLPTEQADFDAKHQPIVVIYTTIRSETHNDQLSASSQS